MQIYKTVPEVGKPPEIYEDDWWRKDDASSYMSESDINGVRSEGLRILYATAEKRSKWFRLVEEGKPMRPTCHIVTQGFLNLASICSYQYGANEWIDAMCIGFLWSIIWGIITMAIFFALLIVFFPVGFIYDVVSGRRSAQAAWFHRKMNEEGYAECGSFAAETCLLQDFEAYGKTLADKLGADKVKLDLCKDMVPKQVLHYDTDENYYVTHQFVRYSMIISWIGPPIEAAVASTTPSDSNV